MESKVKIREMQKADIPKAAEELGKAYATNPVFLDIYRGKPMIARRLRIAFEGMLKYLPGRIFVAELDGRIVGGMKIAKSPDCRSMNLKIMPPVLRATRGWGTLMRQMKIKNAWQKHDPETPHWHLQLLGIMPEFQHQGIGSHWMTFYCDIIDKDGIEAYHETERPENVPFYERFGFKVVAEEIINGTKTWYMLRPAKSAK